MPSAAKSPKSNTPTPASPAKGLGPYHERAAASATPDAFLFVFGLPGALLSTLLTMQLLFHATMNAESMAYIAIGAVWLTYGAIFSAAWMTAEAAKGR